MKFYGVLAAMIAGIVVASFLLVEALEVPRLTDPAEIVGRGGWLAASVGVGLLLADVFLPVPSSLVMIALGAGFGFLGGSLLSLGANVGGAMIGWGVGRFGSDRINRFVSPAERERAARFVGRYGLAAIVISRLIPVLAETTVIMAGATRMRSRPVILAATAGSIPTSLVYALVGSITTGFAAGAYITVGVLLLTGLAWWVGRKWIEADAKAVVDTTAAAD